MPCVSLRRLAQKKLGFRYLMDVIPVDATLIRGSHGLIPDDDRAGPVWISSLSFDGGTDAPELEGGDVVAMTSVKDRVLAAIFGG